MAKEAIRGLSRVASREWGAYNIRVNCVCPSAASPAAAEWMERNPDAAARTLSRIPLGRLGDPELDIGRAVAMLCSDDMAYMTGVTIMLGGGSTILG
jgi:NAD(P)-dependent dehydrogenase (short-subunit alcohol dehydrogenase family)